MFISILSRSSISVCASLSAWVVQGRGRACGVGAARSVSRVRACARRCVAPAPAIGDVPRADTLLKWSRHQLPARCGRSPSPWLLLDPLPACRALRQITRSVYELSWRLACWQVLALISERAPGLRLGPERRPRAGKRAMDFGPAAFLSLYPPREAGSGCSRGTPSACVDGPGRAAG